MVFADSLFWGDVAEDVILLLIMSTDVPLDTLYTASLQNSGGFSASC
jgi:hypothetical protein